MAIPVDPLRVRVRFLGSLPEARRTLFVEQAGVALRSQLDRLEAIRAEATASDGPFWALAVDGALAVTRARLDWLEKVSGRLSEGELDGAGLPSTDDRPPTPGPPSAGS